MDKKEKEYLKECIKNNLGLDTGYIEELLRENEQLERELELKDKVIDEMIEYIEGCVIMEQCNFCNNEESHECNDCIKQYFINKVKGENNG